MKCVLLSLLWVLFGIIYASAQNPFSDPQNTGGWVKYEPLSDEFDGPGIDFTKWKKGSNTWNGRQPVFHTGDNAEIVDGKLRLFAQEESGLPAGYRFSSGYLTSRDIRRYGYFEARIKAADNLLVSTFWMIGGNNTYNREIDILEVGAGAPGRERQVTNNFHTARTTTPDGIDTTDRSRPFHIDDIGFNLTEDFHIYGLEWDRDTCKFYVDGQLIRTATSDDFNIGIGMLLGMEFNRFFAGKEGAELVTDDIERGGVPSEQLVDYVRAWVQPESNQRFYVDALSGDDSNDGLTWGTAKKTVGGAVYASYDGDEIWVARGQYPEQLTISGTRGLEVLGGFLPGATSRDERRPFLYPSIVTALHGWSALYLEGTDNVLVDGLHFTGATVSFTSGVSLGGPVSATTLRRCVFRDNVPLNGAGAGAFVDGGRKLVDVTFDQCVFENNVSLGNFASGGALASRDTVKLKFKACEFYNNESEQGGAIQLGFAEETSYVFENCVFDSNKASAGNAVVQTNRGSMSFDSCTFVNSVGSSIRLPGGVNFTDSFVKNSIFSGATGKHLDLPSGLVLPTGFSDSNLFHNAAVMVDHNGDRNTVSEIDDGVYSTNSIVGDPLLVGPMRRDLRLQISSPALDSGNTTLTTDAGGEGRTGVSDDRGAFERPLGDLSTAFRKVEHTIPGLIEVEHYNLGGPGEGYSDTTLENFGEFYRSDSVDIFFSTSLQQPVVAATAGGEFLNYGVTVDPGFYSIRARVAGGTQPDQLRIVLGAQEIANLTIPASSGADVYEDVMVTNVNLTQSGEEILRLEPGGGLSLDAVEFIKIDRLVGLDIGPAAVAGETTLAGEDTCVEGSATGVGSVSDAIHFAQLGLEGDGAMEVRLDTLSNAVAGLMIRESADADAPFFAIERNPSGSLALRSRTTAGSVVESIPVPGAGVADTYLRVSREEGFYSAFFSSDGASWTVAGLRQAHAFQFGTLAGVYVSSSDGSQAKVTVSELKVDRDQALFPRAYIELPSQDLEISVLDLDANIVFRGTAGVQGAPWSVTNTTVATIPFQNGRNASILTEAAGSVEMRYTQSAAGIDVTDRRIVHVGSVIPGTNVAPRVSAGPDRLEPAGSEVTLIGSVEDEAPLAFSFWSRVGGPAVDGIDANGSQAIISFSGDGQRRIRYTVNDGSITAFDDVFVSFEADSDGDGIPDAWELAKGLDPNLFSDAGLDEDGDGFTNRSEYIFDSDPGDVSTFPNLLVVEDILTGMHTVGLSTSADRNYVIERSSSLLPGAWLDMETVEGDGADWQMTVPSAADELFYRARAYRTP